MYKDLVEQQTTTTGTGAYTVSGTVTGRQTFADAFVTGNSQIPYVVTDDAGNFECGLGTWTEATLQLARTAVLTSSNANTAVSWAAGTKRIYVGAHSSLMSLVSVKHNIINTAAQPSANDDSTVGYGIGSMWIDSARSRFYVCRSGTTAAADWMQVGVLNQYGSMYLSGGSNTSVGNAYADAVVVSSMANTTDATPRKMAYKDDYATNSGIYCEGASCTTITGSVTAIDNTSGDIASWKVEAVIQTATDGTATVRAGGTPTSLFASAGAAAWSIAVVTGSFDAAGWSLRTTTARCTHTVRTRGKRFAPA